MFSASPPIAAGSEPCQHLPSAPQAVCVELAMQVKPQQQQQQATKRDPNSLTLAELGREQVDFAAFGGMSGFGEKFDKEFARGESIGRMLLAKVGSVPSAHGGSNEAA
jgi:hypothetical protein